MERLIDGVQSQISQTFPCPARQIYICPCNSIDELADKVKPYSTHFGLFLAIDARKIDSKRFAEPAAKLLKRGMAFLCAWGPDCERVLTFLMSGVSPEI